MASTLFFETNQLNHRLTIPYHPLCISWNDKNKRWKYSLKNKWKLVPHLFVMYFLIWIIYLTEIFCIMISLVNKLDLYLIHEISINLFIGSFFPLGSFDEIIMLLYGREIVAFANWGIETSIRLKFQNDLNTKTQFTRALLNENLKVCLGKEVDWIALITSHFLISSAFLMYFLPVTLTFENLDYPYLVLKAIASKHIFNGPNFTSLCFMKILRYILMCYIYHCFASAVTYFVTILFSCGQVSLNVVKYLRQMELGFFQIKLYRQLQLGFRLIYTVIQMVNGVFLSVAFFLLLICINLSVFGRGFVSLNMHTVILSFILILAVFVMIVFNIGIFVSEMTSELLKRWKCEVHQAVRVKYMNVLVLSLRPISFPVGSVGIIDREIKVNYLNALIDYVVNTLIVCKDFIQ